jgi:hypothetical protein
MAGTAQAGAARAGHSTDPASGSSAAAEDGGAAAAGRGDRAARARREGILLRGLGFRVEGESGSVTG